MGRTYDERLIIQNLHKKGGLLGRLFLCLIFQNTRIMSSLFPSPTYFLIIITAGEIITDDSVTLKRSINVRNFILIFIIQGLCLTLSCKAQKDKHSSESRRAIKLFEEARGKYEYSKNEEAEKLLQQAIKEDNDFFEAHMMLANVLDDLGKNQDAIQHYKKAIEIQPDRFPPNYYNLAKDEMLTGAYSDAIIHLEKFFSYPKIHPETRKKAEKLLANARFADNAVKNPVEFEPRNLGKNVNSIYDEYYPALTSDEKKLIYTRRRPADKLSDVFGSKFEEDLYISSLSENIWSPSHPMPTPLNTHGNEGAHCVSPDGKNIFFVGCQRPEGLGSCDIYLSSQSGESWSVPVNLKTVNSESWDTQPTISANGNELIFISKRSGGLGGGDLWISRKDKSGEWMMPENMGNILNTPNEEAGPFLHPDGITLFFSSAGHPGMGGQDLYYSRRNPDGSWGKPVNLGYPINTVSDEERLSINAPGTHAYYSSTRPGGMGGKDIYMFDLPASLRPKPVTYLHGIITDIRDGKPVKAGIQVVDLATKELKGSAISDRVTGEYLVCLPSGGQYALNISAQGYLFYSGNYDLRKNPNPNENFEADVSLIPIRAGTPVVLQNIFFNTASWDLLPESETELDKLAEFIRSNPGIHMEISGHTDNQGKDQDNLTLSLKRAESVVNYLITKGIDKKYLLAKGYGESKPVAGNETEEGRRQNRRTEFVIFDK